MAVRLQRSSDMSWNLHGTLTPPYLTSSISHLTPLKLTEGRAEWLCSSTQQSYSIAQEKIVLSGEGPVGKGGRHGDAHFPCFPDRQLRPRGLVLTNSLWAEVACVTSGTKHRGAPDSPSLAHWKVCESHVAQLQDGSLHYLRLQRDSGWICLGCCEQGITNCAV